MDEQTVKKLSLEEQEKFAREGYLVARQLLRQEEVEELLQEMMGLNEQMRPQGQINSVPGAQVDPLIMYPRILYPHRKSAVAHKYMLHPRVMHVLGGLFGEEPLAAQSMMYFKPPGARGQALHQDNYYLRVEPGTCIAAWVALDATDESNGGLVVVPRTNTLEIQCPHEADLTKSFVNEEVDLPEGAVIVAVTMQPGDVLFFNGSTIHGSFPNATSDRFRRSFICHYVGESTLKIGRHINMDLYTRTGERVSREGNDNAGPCGTALVGEAH
ncbi:phytanoyl-CoA dioxygenase family protein [Paenibacillus sp. HJGM_3]|uniref:phytanoyl-CoA dioxygenase family protein n=1 Tax=Paenibacillus sp. HJGM_3 TaxID=3379816 RepID=UPI00385DE2B8